MLRGEREREREAFCERNVCQTAIKYHNESYDKEFLADITNSHMYISFSAYLDVIIMIYGRKGREKFYL